MVRPKACRRDDYLGLVTDRTGQVHSRTVTASSRGVKGRHSTSDIPITPAPLGLGIYYYNGLVLLSHHTIHTLRYSMRYMDLLSPHLHHMTRMHMVLLCLPICPAPLNEVSGPGVQLGASFFDQLMSRVPVYSSYSRTDYTATNYGIPSSEPCLGRDSGDIGLEGDKDRSEEHDMVGSLHIRKEDDKLVFVAPASSSGVRPGPGKGKELSNGFRSMMKLIPSYSGHIASSIWRRQSDLGIIYSGGGINAQELAQVAENPDSGLSPEHRAACYITYLLESSFFTDKSGNIIHAKL
ncbi:hypothetical protein M9H77_13179 [Catharanthus roseus]|uniref:Uncharacterized protein n=1 Tax=Catharanthus roseus TaxID=4058 RepID=A0ACC0BJD2_CATRO|nr:hypothetical protein M9H77_13179 [Catharanthus roseus]